MNEQKQLSEIFDVPPSGDSVRPTELGRLPEEWGTVRLDDVAADGNHTFVDAPFGSDLKADEMHDEGYARTIMLGNIGEGEFIDTNRRYISKKKYDELTEHTAKPGDIAIAKLGVPVGRACLLPDIEPNYILAATDTVKLTPSPDFSADFVMNSLNSRIVWRTAYARARGSGRKRINLEQLKEVRIPAPPLDEQKRIAETLRTIDEITHQKVENIKKRIQEQRRMAQGVTHDLLSGQVRFGGADSSDFISHGDAERPVSIGEIPTDWTVRKIGEISDNNRKSFKEDDWEYDTIKYTSLSDVSEGDIKNQKEIPADDTPSRAQRIAKEGDILVGKVRPEQKNHAIVTSEFDGDVFSSGFEVLTVEEGTDENYLLHEILSHRFLRQMNAYAAGAGYPSINGDNLEDLKVVLPPELEQQRIAEYLTKIRQLNDDLTELMEVIVRKHQRIREGITEDLISGKVRLSNDSDSSSSEGVEDGDI